MCQFKNMGFKTQFESGRGVDIPDFWCEGVPESRARAAEGSTSTGRQTGRRNSEMNLGKKI